MNNDKIKKLETPRAIYDALVTTGIKSDRAWVEHQIIPQRNLFQEVIGFYWRKQGMVGTSSGGATMGRWREHQYPNPEYPKDPVEMVKHLIAHKFSPHWLPLSDDDLKEFDNDPMMILYSKMRQGL